MRNPERNGKTAYIRYKGGIQGEEALDDRSIREPLAVVLGAGSLPRGIEDALYEMEIGEIRLLIIAPEQGFGLHDPAGVQWYPRTIFENGYELESGSVVPWLNPATQQMMPGYVVDATQDTVRIDRNHPFAGKTLEYHLELLDIQ
jgi:FKBP-type peptidyl-prolyl cis-trans isomerase 2